MQTHQAIVFTCAEETLSEDLTKFIETDLNLYAVDRLNNAAGIRVLLDDTEERNQIFAKFENCFAEHNASRIIIFSHMNCVDLGNESFESAEDEARERELKLRHAISVTQSKYPDKQVEAYLALIGDGNQITFKKVI